MSLPRLLILAQFAPPALARLGEHFEVIYESWLDTGALQDPEELGARLAREKIAYLVTEADFVFAETFAAAPNLRFVGLCRGEVGQHVDLEAAAAAGVRVVTTPGRNAVSVAELTLGLMLSLARRLPQANTLVHGGHWDSVVDNYAAWGGTELAGRVAGLVGCGAVGREVARRLVAMDMRVMACDPYLPPAALPPGVEPSDMDSLLAGSDFISLHCELTPETRGLLGAPQLALLKPTAFLVNTARAAVVDETSLLSLLQGYKIAGAGLDTHYVEPLPPGSPWLALDNVVLTPHIGGATTDVVRHHSRLMSEALERFLAETGEPIDQ